MVPCENLSVRMGSIRSVYCKAAVSIRPGMSDRDTGFCRPDSGDVFQRGRPSDRHIIRRRQLPGGTPRIINPLVAGFIPDLIDSGNRSLRILQLASIRASQHINGRFHRLRGSDRRDDGIPFGVDMKAHHRIGVVGTQNYINVELFAAGINDGGLISILEQAIVGNSLTLLTYIDGQRGCCGGDMDRFGSEYYFARYAEIFVILAKTRINRDLVYSSVFCDIFT